MSFEQNLFEPIVSQGVQTIWKGYTNMNLSSAGRLRLPPYPEPRPPSQVINQIQDYILHPSARQNSLTHLTYVLQLNTTFTFKQFPESQSGTKHKNLKSTAFLF